MRKTDIDAILLVNWYFTTCKLSNPHCPKTEVVRRYLLRKVSDVINKNKGESFNANFLVSKALLFFIVLINNLSN